MNKWNWNEKTKSIGAFTLDAPVETFMNVLTQLERYEYENYDTFMIKDSNFSKLFVINGIIYSIQCAQHFIVNGDDLIGRTFDECERIFGTRLFLYSDYPQFPEYVVPGKKLKLTFNGDNRALYVIYFSDLHVA